MPTQQESWVLITNRIDAFWCDKHKGQTIKVPNPQETFNYFISSLLKQAKEESYKKGYDKGYPKGMSDGCNLPSLH